MGEVCEWLGRTYQGLEQAEKAKKFFDKALSYYQEFEKDKKETPLTNKIKLKLKWLPGQSDASSIPQAMFKSLTQLIQPLVAGASPV